MQNFLFILQSVTPVFLIMFLGIALKRARIINDRFVTDSSRLVFNVSMPVLIFLKLSDIDFNEVFRLGQMLYLYAATGIAVALIWLFARRTIPEDRDKGAFIQGAFRSNFAIVGLAVILNLFGEEALGKAAMVLAVMLPFHNLLSVVILTVSASPESKLEWKTILCRVLKNPLIIAAAAATVFAVLEIPLHAIFIKTGDYLAALTLPLALLGIGGSFNLHEMKHASRAAFAAAGVKLILLPAAGTWGAVCAGMRDLDLAVVFVLFAAPTAIASFVMARAMGANSRLAGNIVIISTFGAVITLTLGLTLLKSCGLI